VQFLRFQRLTLPSTSVLNSSKQLFGLLDPVEEEATLFWNISQYTTSQCVTSHKAQSFNYTVNLRYELTDTVIGRQLTGSMSGHGAW
jgi:hypothetical protein